MSRRSAAGSRAISTHRTGSAAVPGGSTTARDRQLASTSVNDAAGYGPTQSVSRLTVCRAVTASCCARSGAAMWRSTRIAGDSTTGCAATIVHGAATIAHVSAHLTRLLHTRVYSTTAFNFALISRRSFLRGAAVGAFSLPLQSVVSRPAPEVLYNGITLGTPWPPRRRYADEYPVAVPYLVSPPAVIPIDVGRQLLVDDFLIEETSMMRQWHHATYHPANPILRPETTWEHRDDVNQPNNRPSNPASMVYSDGVFFDPSDRLFKMWYMGGYGMNSCLATSRDGVSWERPAFDVVRGTNIVHNQNRDSSTVWLDLHASDRRERFKMTTWYDHSLLLWTSPDGIHWTMRGQTGRTGDRSTFFHNPFRNVWVYSLRANQFEASISGRYRHYWETRDFTSARSWSPEPVAWVKADSRDFSHAEV